MEIKKRIIREKKCVQVAGLKGGEKVLDLGCGNCNIIKLCPNIKYTGIDLLNIRKFYSDLLNFKSVSNSDIINFDLEKGLPSVIKRQKFDVIFLIDFIEYIENFKTLLKECSRILRRGKIIICTPSNNRLIFLEEHKSHIHCFRKTNIKNLAAICDLKLTKIIGTYISIPILNIFPVLDTFFETNQTFYTDNIIYVLEKTERR